MCDYQAVSCKAVGTNSVLNMHGHYCQLLTTDIAINFSTFMKKKGYGQSVLGAECLLCLKYVTD